MGELTFFTLFRDFFFTSDRSGGEGVVVRIFVYVLRVGEGGWSNKCVCDSYFKCQKV